MVKFSHLPLVTVLLLIDFFTPYFRTYDFFFKRRFHHEKSLAATTFHLMTSCLGITILTEINLSVTIHIAPIGSGTLGTIWTHMVTGNTPRAYIS